VQVGPGMSTYSSLAYTLHTRFHELLYKVSVVPADMDPIAVAAIGNGSL
jgi:hypothetical protein